MKFFIFATKTDDEAKSVYDEIVKFNSQQTGRKIIERKIFAIDYNHNSKVYRAECGKIEQRTGETVIAILQTDQIFFVCTPNRGVLRGEPILVGVDEVSKITDFD